MICSRIAKIPTVRQCNVLLTPFELILTSQGRVEKLRGHGFGFYSHLHPTVNILECFWLRFIGVRLYYLHGEKEKLC